MMTSPLYILLTLALMSHMTGVRARTSGPPDGACDAMFPGHGPDAQSSDPPFEILVDDTEFTAGQTLTVTVRSTGSTQFKGFFIQARKELTPAERVGEMVLGDNVIQQLIACDGGDGVGHNPPLASRSEVTVSWTAPDPAPESNIFFRATLVEDFSTFWVGVESDVVIDPTADQDATAPPATTLAPFEGTVDLSACGNSKGCYIEPEDCESNCDRAVTWTPASDNETSVHFEITGDTDGWLGMGFSKDDKMGSDYVLMCVRDGDTAAIVQSYNDGRSNGPFSNRGFGISNAEVSYVDGVVTCVFDREIDDSTVDGSDSEFVPLDKKYTLLLGAGPGSPSAPRQHDDIPLISDTKVDVTKDTVVVGSDPIDYLMFKLHAIFMITAWMFLISLSLLLARFYKPAFPEKKICGVAIWFALHRFLNIVAVALTIAAFVIIFVEVEDFTEVGDDSGDDLLEADVLKSHPILGMIVTALAIINPLMSLCRPHPDAPRRPIFNWAHWAVGSAAHLVSFVAIFIGFSMPKSRAFIEDANRDWVRWVFVAFAAWHVVFYLVLDVLKCIGDRNKKEAGIKYELEMQSPGYKSTDQSHSSEQSSFMAQYSLLFIYCCGWIAAYTAIIYGIASADTDD